MKKKRQIFLKQLSEIGKKAQIQSISGFRDSESFFNVSVSRLLADHCFDDRGRVDLAVFRDLAVFLPEKKIFQKRLKNHVLLVTQAFSENIQMHHLLSRIGMPLANTWVQKIVNLSLGKNGEFADAFAAKKAIFSALLFPIRQSIGSCFATATTILIQKNQIELMLKDLVDLVTMGHIRRAGENDEIRIPMGIAIGRMELEKVIGSLESFSFHLGWINALKEVRVIQTAHSFDEFRTIIDRFSPKGQTFAQFINRIVSTYFHGEEEELVKEKISFLLLSFSQHALSKAWEYTLASFVDYEGSTSKDNLIISLGLNHSEKSGIGELVYNYLQGRLDVTTEKIEELNEEYYLLSEKLYMAERLIASATSPDKIRRLKNEIQLHSHQIQLCENEKQECIEIAKHFSEFFTFFMDQLVVLFKLYFQEIYDPDLHDEQSLIYEDGAAGFRLVYKYGRADPSVWIIIKSPDEFIKVLRDFFLSSESAIRHICEWEKGKEEIAGIIEAILNEIKKESFLLQAFERAKKIHSQYFVGRRLISLWEYLSGGTLHSLLKGYFEKQNVFSEERCLPKDPMELCIFLIEIMKEMPFSVCEEMRLNPSGGLLMYSPTHVFIFTPGHDSFLPFWDNSYFTYTDLRDGYIEKAKSYYQSIRLSPGKQNFLYQLYCMKTGHHTSHQKLFVDGADIHSFAKEHLGELGVGEADFLMNHLPVFDEKEVHLICKKYKISLKNRIDLLTRDELIEILTAKVGDEDSVIKQLRKEGVLPPSPLIFADSNWEETLFGFAINPLTFSFDFCRVSTNGLECHYMKEWKEDFGKTKPPGWGVFTRPYEFIRDINEIKMRR